MANIFWVMVVQVSLDWILKPSKRKPPEFETGMLPNFILLTSSLLHIIVIFFLIRGIVKENIEGWHIIVCALSTGINSGLAGFIVAHELVHRKTAFERTLGQINLLAGNYLHFYIEHIHGHHRTVATTEDPATARYGEDIYRYMARTIPYQWWNALQTEVKRIKKEGSENPYGLSNYVIQTTILEISVLTFIGVFFGPIVFAAYVGQNLVAIFLLEYVNYIEHYGLTRNRSQKISAIHAWHTDTPASRMSLFELNRHADHHLKASKQFYTLNAHEESPVLPSGYFGMFYVALFPKWWFRKVNPLVPKEFLPENNGGNIS
jgi:alkane 1-monooxygenase